MKQTARPREGKQPVVAAAILDSLTSPERLLCTSRAYPETLRGLYEFPGGKVEPGESGTDALHRELLEELSLRVSLGAEVLPPVGGSAKLSPTNAGWPILEGRTMRVWLASPLPHQRAIPDASHLDAIWVNLSEVSLLPWLPTNQPILRQLLHVLGR